MKTLAALTMIAATASAQSFDTSGNATLRGAYFIREVLLSGDTTTGKVSSASSVIGTATFDGNGNYAFTGQGATLSGGAKSSLTLSGTYKVSGSGLFVMQSLADPTDFEFGGVSSVGPSAFVASATEGLNISMLIGIPAAAVSTITNAGLTGSYSTAAFDFPSADQGSVRQATFTLTSDAAGGFGTVSVSGTGLNLGGTTQTQSVAGVTYSLAGAGSGTINFGAAANARLVSGAKTFFVSADKNIILGGSPTGFDLLVGIRSATGTSTNATANGIYYMGALEELVDTTGQNGNQLDAFYGSVNANGAGTSIYHNRIQSLQYLAYDYTVDSFYNVAANGTIAPPDLPYNFTLGANGQAFIATGVASGTGPLYSLTLGLAAPKYSGTGVYVNPLGIVSAANFAPVTNPIAPNELIAIFGSGMASGNFQAANLPFPTTLGGVTVSINGVLAPLVRVTPTQINALVPSSITPDAGVYYATVKVTNNGTASNAVTVYTSTTAPGVFFGNSTIGPAAAQHPNFSVIGSSSPAAIGEIVTIYAGGLGATTPPVVDGAPAPATAPLSTVNAAVYVDFSGTQAPNITYAGLTPTTSGLYQVNVQIPPGTGSNVYVNLSTPDALTSEATLNVAGVSAKARGAKAAASRRIGRAKAGPGLTGRAQ